MHSEPVPRSSKTDLLLVSVLLIVATAVRLPYLQLIPTVTDEAFEVLAALPVSQGDLLLYGPVDPTTGPLVTYLLAVAFWLFGPGVYLPRIVILVVGVLTVGATYMLGRSIKGRKAGFIAGALLAFSPIHIIVNSHVAWSNSATPLFTTLTFAVLHIALQRKDGRLLVLAGFLYGLALQTHISMVVVLPGLLIWFLARRDILTWLSRPWPYLAVGAALLGYANMIVYNLITAGGGLANFQGHTYAWVSEPSWSAYWTNLKVMVEAVALTLGGQVPKMHLPLNDVVTAVLLVWLVAALVYATWRGERMPILVMLSTALIMPYFNKRYEGLFSQRYTAFLLPLAFATMGLAATRAMDFWRRKPWPLPRAATVGGMVLVLLLAIYPVRTTFTYYATETQGDRDNRATLAMTTTLKEILPPNAPLYVSRNLRGPEQRADGGYKYLRAMYYYLTLEGVPFSVLELPDLEAQLEAHPNQEAWLLLYPTDYEALAGQLPIERIEGVPPIPNEGLLAKYVPAEPGP
jgi:4-amino-4-deoxy-L-arabinose transferase-like glycosyltransferase